VVLCTLGLILIASCSTTGTPEQPPSERVGRVFFLALDGATWDVMRPMMNEGELPHFSAAIGSGCAGTMTSLRESVSPTIWTSIATGVPPRVHGIDNFWYYVDGKRHLFTSDDVKAPRVSEILSHRGVRVGVTNYWLTFPATPVNGFVISDHTIPSRSSRVIRYFSKGQSPPPEEERLVYPTEFHEQIKPLLTTRRPSVPGGPVLDEAISDETAIALAFVGLQDTFIEDREVVEMSLAGLRAHASRLNVLYLKGIDRVSHSFWRFYEPDHPFYGEARPTPQEVALFGDAIPWVYRHTDALLGMIRRVMGAEDVLIILSDHGFQAIPPKTRLSDSGSHGYSKASVDGIYLVSGGPVSRKACPKRISLYDVAPTILYLLGAPIPQYMDGSAQTALFSASFVEKQPLTYSKDVMPKKIRLAPRGDIPGEEDRIKRLRALGYSE
jgi:hypothetical protein